LQRVDRSVPAGRRGSGTMRHDAARRGTTRHDAVQQGEVAMADRGRVSGGMAGGAIRMTAAECGCVRRARIRSAW
jgi:hypothetical protein